MRPPPLKPGDRIELIAPAGPFDRDRVEDTIRCLEGYGYRITRGEHLFDRQGYLAGSEADRAGDLIRALTDPTVAAVLCARGGYGCSRLLPWLPFSALRSHPKIFLGHSDITFLHLAFLSRMDWVTFHGPNANGMADVPRQIENVAAVLRGEEEFHRRLDEVHILRHGTASGKVIGTNLTCMSHLLGTPYFPDAAGALLLVEDCSEALYRLDRLFTHLKLAGVLPRIGGLILGEFTNCAETQAILDMVMEQVRFYRFPVIAGLPFGHGPRNEVIPLGVPFSLNTRERTLKALRSPFER